MLYAQAPAPCSNPRIRRDFREVDKAGDWIKVVAAYQKMKSTGRILYYANLHNENFSKVHNTGKGNFATWHRAFLWEFENELRKVSGDPSLTIPYIDWGAEASAFQGLIDKSAAITPKFYAQQNGQCLTGQIYDSFALPKGDSRGTCIYRQNTTTGTQQEFVLSPGWADIDNQVTKFSDFTKFSNFFENGFHNEVHRKFGGILGTSSSPFDPLFFAHHGFVESVFQNWQFVHNYSAVAADFKDPITLS